MELDIPYTIRTLDIKQHLVDDAYFYARMSFPLRKFFFGASLMFTFTKSTDEMFAEMCRLFYERRALELELLIIKEHKLVKEKIVNFVTNLDSYDDKAVENFASELTGFGAMALYSYLSEISVTDGNKMIRVHGICGFDIINKIKDVLGRSELDTLDFYLSHVKLSNGQTIEELQKHYADTFSKFRFSKSLENFENRYRFHNEKKTYFVDTDND